MKLFVWNDPLEVPWGGSILYAVAETVEQAREIAMKAPLAEYGLDHEPLTEGSTWEGRFVLGEPIRIIEAPYAEIYQWNE